MIFMISQCLIMLSLCSIRQAQSILSKEFNDSEFTASLWFRVMDELNINTKILELQQVDVLTLNQTLLTIELQQLEDQVILIFKDSKYTIELKQSDNWVHLVIRKQQASSYDEFNITLDNYKSSQQVIVKQLQSRISQVRFLYWNVVQFENIQIASPPEDFVFACLPGCQFCRQENLFACYNCFDNRIVNNVNLSCECPNTFMPNELQCMSKYFELKRYQTQGQLNINMLFVSFSNESICQSNHLIDEIDISGIIPFRSYMENDSYTSDSDLQFIYIQTDQTSSINLLNYKENQLFDWTQTIIFYLNFKQNVYELELDQLSYYIKEFNIINQLLRSPCMNKTMNLTIINITIINQTLNQTLFYDDISSLQVFNFTIENSHIQVEELFRSQSLIVNYLRMINCTIVNSVLFKSNHITISDAKIEDCQFLNASIIRGKLETLIMTNISLLFIQINNINSLINAWGAIEISINMFQNSQISQNIQAVSIGLSGQRISLMNIRISNKNSTNNFIEGLIFIQGQNVLINNLCFEQIYGIYAQPLMKIDSQENQSRFEIKHLIITFIYIEMVKIQSVVEIQQTSGQVFLSNLFIMNLYIVQDVLFIYFNSEYLWITQSYFAVDDRHQGFKILSRVVTLDNLKLNANANANQILSKLSFIQLLADQVYIQKCWFEGRLVLLQIYSKTKENQTFLVITDTYVYMRTQILIINSAPMILIDNFSQIRILNNTFAQTRDSVRNQLFRIIKGQDTIISDCKVSYISAFVFIEQVDIFSELKVYNLSCNINFQSSYFLTTKFIHVQIGKVIFLDIMIISFQYSILLDNISEVAINRFQVQKTVSQATLIDIQCSSNSNLIVNIHNMTFKDIILIKFETIGLIINSIIKIRSKKLTLKSSSLTFFNIQNLHPQTEIISITSDQLYIVFIHLRLIDCKCQYSCISLNQTGMQNQIQQMDINFEYSTFIKISGFRLFQLHTQAYGQQQISIKTSTFLQNSFNFMNILEHNQIVGIIECDIEYNNPPIDQSQLKIENSKGREYVSDIQILLSTDNGEQYALNRQIQQKKYEVIFKKFQSITNIFYIPTGQYFKDFILFNYQALSYKLMSIQFYFQIRNGSSDACNLNYINKSIHFEINNQNWDSLMITSKPNTIVEFNISCQIEGETYSLIFFGKVLECQIGEILLDNICFRCPVLIQQYSVKKYSSYCKPIDRQKMSEVYYGLINLNISYWRPSIQNDIIEECNQYQQSCKGGYHIANKICKQGYIGAICSDCDLNNQMGYGRYVKNSANQCEQCQSSSVDILKFIIYVIMQQIQLFSSAYFILSNAQQFLLISRVKRISKIVKQKFVLFDFPADRITIYAQFLLEYFQTLTLTNNYSIGQLMPFIFRPNIFENASFTYMNYIDCFIAPLFSQDYWIYNRLFYLLSCYIIIFYTYLILYLICLKYKKFRYQFIMISVPILNLYSNNIISFITQIILITIPIQYSSMFWIQTRTSHQYFTAIHKEAIISIVTTQLALMVIIPLIFYCIQLHKIVKNMKSRWTQSFTYLIYQYNQEYHFANYLNKLNSLTLIIVVYLFQRQVNTRIFILIIMALIAYYMLNKFQVYKYRVLNRLTISIQLLFMAQLMINGIVESTQQWFIQYLLKLIYYLISVIIIYLVCLKAFPDIDLENLQWTDRVRSLLGLQLRLYKIKQIKQSFQFIKNNLGLIIEHNSN